MRRLVFGLSTGLLVASAQVALAHVQLRAPIQREIDQKDGPCGVVYSVRGPNVCTFRPGSTITIAWDETVEHEGHFRVSFDTDGQDGFINPTTPADTNPTVINNNVADRNVMADGNQRYTLDITFPNVECENCTLQVIQVMSTGATYVEDDLYYQCADIVLSNAAPETPDPNCIAPPPVEDPPPDGDDDGDPPDDGSGDDDGAGGDETHTGAEAVCAIAGDSGRDLFGTVLVLLGALVLQRRRRRM